MVDSLLKRRALFGEASWYPPRPGMVERVLQQHGADPDRYQAVFYLACIRDFDVASGRWELRGRGGAFTEGIGANGRYGISWWEVTHAWHAAGNNWLAVHEFHHQLDELFARSDFPEYWFNHFAPVAGTAADFGEHFDGNAFILRHWPADKWFALHYGELTFAADADGDGLPDADPALPMDERRLGSNPARQDSDGDGVADRDELAFSNWVIEGQSEQYGAPARLPDLSAADTDGDGLADGADPYPLYPWLPEVVQAEFRCLGETKDPRAQYKVEIKWGADSLYFRLHLPANRRVRLLLDADANGWFVGRDNFEFKLDTSDSLAAAANLFNAGHPTRWPFMDAALAEQVKFTWRALPQPGRYQLAIARNPALGLQLEKGERIGLDIGVSARMDERGHEKHISIYEPNRFFDFRLH